MKYIIIYTFLFYGFTTARPQNFRFTRYDDFNDGYGNYRYAYRINDDIILHQNGELKLATDDTYVTVANGAYSVVTPDNVIQEVRYVADENGYRSHVVIAKQDVDPLNINSVKVGIEDEKVTASGLVTLKSIINEVDVSPTTVPPISSSATTNAATTNSQEFESKTSTESEYSHPQVVAENTKLNTTTELQTNHSVVPIDFPDRIGTPVIISLQGAPG